MGGIAIIGMNQAHNAAPPSEYGALYHALGGNNGQQSITNRYIIINGAGEAVTYSSQTSANWTPALVGARVRTQGLVWIDYCGFPFYYQVGANGVVKTLGPSGWTQFASRQAAGYQWLSRANFIVPASATQTITSPSFPIARGFPLSESLDGVCYSTGKITIPGGFLGIGGGTWPLTAQGYTAMFALHPAGGGYYFYAASVPAYLAIRTHTILQSVGIPTFSTFIRNVLSGNTSGYQCQPYQIGVQHTHTITPAPSSPVQTIRSPRQTPGGTPSGTSLPPSTSKSSTNHSALVEDLLIGGTVATGLGLVTVAILRGKGPTHR